MTTLVDGHASNRYHGDAAEAALAFKRSVEQPQDNIDVCLNMEQENRQIINCCVQCILYCGRQCIALRGDIEQLANLVILENLCPCMVKVLANYDPILKGHVEMPSQRNATYNSPRIQMK